MAGEFKVLDVIDGLDCMRCLFNTNFRTFVSLIVLNKIIKSVIDIAMYMTTYVLNIYLLRQPVVVTLRLISKHLHNNEFNVSYPLQKMREIIGNILLFSTYVK